LNLYTYNYGYDGLARSTSSAVNRVSDGATLFSQSRTFDAVGNVASANTVLPQGTDNQAFCYDEQNRLTWAGASDTPSCGSSLTAGTLTTAQYTQTFGYDTLNRLTNGPAGGNYLYQDVNHLDAITGAGTGYTAGYDLAGDMSCRAPTSSLTCGGTSTGQQMNYDQLRRMTSWQNQKTAPTNSALYAYDGEGQRVQQTVTNNGTATTTQYIGGFEEISTTGTTVNTTKYYDAGVKVISTNGTLSYTAMDGLGSMSANLDGAGNVTADQLFAPYGTTRYTSGTMPTAKAFTGQYQDGSGLAYYNARYYDPTVGQFGSADNVQGSNRFAYVAGNPETNTDPTGNYFSAGVGSHLSCHWIPSEGKCYESTTNNDSGANSCGEGYEDVNGKCIHIPGYGDGVCGRDIAINSNTNCQLWDTNIHTLEVKGNNDYLLGVGLTILADFIKLETQRDFVSFALTALDLLSIIANNFLVNLDDPSWGQLAVKINEFVGWGLGIINTVRALGFFGQALADGSFVVFKFFMGGIPGLIFGLITTLVGPLISGGLDLFGQFNLAQSAQEKSDAKIQRNMSITDWCNTYGGGKCQKNY
jgi:RHS repeat-associated protein